MWMSGDKKYEGLPLMLHMAAHGWVCVNVNYRLAPKHLFPAQIIDIKRAIAWIRAHGEEYGADPAYIAISGGSAGGHLAALAALSPGDPEYQPGFEGADTTVQAAVPHYGIYDFAAVSGTDHALKRRDRFLARFVMKKDPVTDREDFERASPVLRANADAPPFFVLHGAHDTGVEVAEARYFVQRMREQSRQPVVYAELPGAQHAFDFFPSIRSAHTVRAVERFLFWSLGEHRARTTGGAGLTS
ncbi:MAG: alpha/beta hydrolase, partial [Mycobacteriaceae bacterium]